MLAKFLECRVLKLMTDCISNLPAKIIHSILFCLPSCIAVRTSILFRVEEYVEIWIDAP